MKQMISELANNLGADLIECLKGGILVPREIMVAVILCVLIFFIIEYYFFINDANEIEKIMMSRLDRFVNSSLFYMFLFLSLVLKNAIANLNNPMYAFCLFIFILSLAIELIFGIYKFICCLWRGFKSGSKRSSFQSYLRLITIYTFFPVACRVFKEVYETSRGNNINMISVILGLSLIEFLSVKLTVLKKEEKKYKYFIEIDNNQFYLIGRSEGYLLCESRKKGAIRFLPMEELKDYEVFIDDKKSNMASEMNTDKNVGKQEKSKKFGVNNKK